MLPSPRAAKATGGAPRDHEARDVSAWTRKSSLLSEQALEFGSSGICSREIRGLPRAHPRLEMIAEVGAFLVPHLVGSGFTTMLCDRRVVVDAELARVKFGTTLGALVESSQRQR